MKFKIDENLPSELAQMLCDAGYDALTVYQQQHTGEPDNFIARICQEEKRAIVTLDIGFSDIRSYWPADFYGIIVLRLRTQDKNHVIEVFRQLISMFEENELTGKLWIVDEDKVRIRE